jgi:hypothetical protein
MQVAKEAVSAERRLGTWARRESQTQGGMGGLNSSVAPHLTASNVLGPAAASSTIMPRLKGMATGTGMGGATGAAGGTNADGATALTCAGVEEGRRQEGRVGGEG